MENDRLYCIVCGKYSIDINNLYDSRNNGKPSYIAPKKLHYIWNCPFCKSNHMINVNQTIIREEKIINRNENNFKGSMLYKKFKKDWPQQKALNSQNGSI